MAMLYRFQAPNGMAYGLRAECEKTIGREP